MKKFQNHMQGNWKVVLQNPQRSLVLYNSARREIRAVPASGTSIMALDNWTSPSYFQILSNLFTSFTRALPLSLNDFLMNGYFDTYFPKRKKIGSGGCGTVYRVEHSLAGINLAVYACKVIPVGEFSWLQRVINEVRLLEKLNQTPHPLILGYKHCWIEEWQTATFGPKIPCLFILMEFSELGSVESMLETKRIGYYKKITVDNAWQIFVNILLSVNHIHSLGILHRDLKLSNILMMKDSGNFPYPARFVLSDFGISCDMDNFDYTKPRTGGTGTIETMAPELLIQNENNEYIYRHSFASDVWSLGVMTFSLFFACSPFLIEGGEERLRNYTNLDLLIEELKLNKEDVPPVAYKLIDGMMRRDPKKRILLNDVINEPFISMMIHNMSLDELLNSDKSKVQIVSPSMEDLASSLPLALTMDPEQEEENQAKFNEEFDIEKAAAKNNFLDLCKPFRVIMLLSLLSLPYKSKIVYLIHFFLSLVIFYETSFDLNYSIIALIMAFLSIGFGLSTLSIFHVALLGYVSYLLVTIKAKSQL